ncbi:MAG: SMC family ATPase, partial [Chloroflexota bacterium]|nr:SMC family ATPase [Chloroflexota bacterium]
MIPLHLRITGFLSYRDTVELDFTTFDLACISGHNGAGKSSLLDAITWSLFGEARGRSSDVINLHPDAKAAEVVLTFQHEENTYRVQRTLPRNKSTMLEFQVRTQTGWKPLTEKTTRETQTRIEQTLRLDFETFVNASFFLQGKADQFTQQNATRRKEVLSNILGLEMWEEYKNRTAEKRKLLEHDVDELDGRMREIDAELAEEDLRKARLEELESSLKQLTVQRTAQESVLDNIKRNAALLGEQRKMTALLSEKLEREHLALAGLKERLATKHADRDSFADLVHRAREIESAYRAWQKSRKELEKWEETASRFREYEKDRAPLLELIAVEKARLEQELESLQEQASAADGQKTMIGELQEQIAAAETLLTEAETRATERLGLEAQKNAARERQAELKAENEALKADMSELKERIDSLRSAQGADCPLCGQELSPEHRLSTLVQLETEGRQKGDHFRANQATSAELSSQITSYELQISQLASAENERVRYASQVSQLTERLENINLALGDWEVAGEKRLREVQKLLETGKYAVEEQKQIARLDKELTKLGYDIAAHEAARETEIELRAIEEEYTNLKSAKEVSKQIDGEITSLKSAIKNREAEIETLDADYQRALASLQAAEAGAPDLDAAERDLFRLREAENRIRSELGGAKQRVDILETQR